MLMLSTTSALSIGQSGELASISIARAGSAGRPARATRGSRKAHWRACRSAAIRATKPSEMDACSARPLATSSTSPRSATREARQRSVRDCAAPPARSGGLARPPARLVERRPSLTPPPARFPDHCTPAPASSPREVSSSRRRGACTGAALRLWSPATGALGDRAQRGDDELIEARLDQVSVGSTSIAPSPPAGSTWSSGGSPRRSAPWQGRACLVPRQSRDRRRSPCMRAAVGERRVEHALKRAQDVIGVGTASSATCARPSAPWLSM